MDIEEMEELSIDTLVPEFEMTTYDPEINDFGKFSLKEQKNKKRWTVLVFYPADYTFVCPTELSDFGTKKDELSKLGVDILSISTDTEFVHMAWHREEKLLQNVTFKMGADHNGFISQLFGIYDYKSGLAYRGTFIIDPTLRLVGSEVNSNNVGRNADELVRKVKAFIYVSLHPEQVCPAKWKEGDKTITPGPNAVGNAFVEKKK